MGLYIFYVASFVFGCIVSIVEHHYNWIPMIIILYIAIGAVFYMFMIAPVKNRDHKDDSLQ